MPAIVIECAEGAGMPHETYPFNSSDTERQRLIAQNGLMTASTQRLFEKAGIASGMRVLDIGSGGGGVAFLAPGLVGPRGAVVGTPPHPGPTRLPHAPATRPR